MQRVILVFFKDQCTSLKIGATIPNNAFMLFEKIKNEEDEAPLLTIDAEEEEDEGLFDEWSFF